MIVVTNKLSIKAIAELKGRGYLKQACDSRQNIVNEVKK